jgi:hypothetical protein
MPIRAVRKDKVFINDSVPHIFGIWLKDGGEIRSPSKVLWNGLKPKLFLAYPYPTIDANAWYTYKKDGDKVKRVPLAQYQKKEG